MVLTRINAFIVTLATMTIVDGLRYGVNGPGTYQGYSPACSGRAGLVAGLPVVFLAAVRSPSRYGCSSPAPSPGGTCWPAAAARSRPGCPASPTTGRSWSRTPCSGLLAGVAAVLTLAQSGSVNATIGDDLLLPSFAAPIIGGVALAGGVVSVLGTSVAAFIVRLVDVTQAQFGINRRWVDLIVGAVVLGAVLVGAVRQKLSRRSS